MRITATNIDEVSRRLRLYGQRLGTWRSLWRSIAGDVARAEIQWFASRGAGAWRPLSRHYAEWKAKHFPGKPLLVQSGKLRAAATSATSLLGASAASSAVIRIADPKAAFHAPGHSGPVPVRDPAIPISQARAIIRRRLSDHIRYRAGIPGPVPRRGLG